MSDLRTILERGVGGATPPPDGFERMLRLRDRRRRNQRIAAGVVGFAIAIGVALLGVSVIRSTSSVPGDESRPPTPSPEEERDPGDIDWERVPGVSIDGDAIVDTRTGEVTSLPASIASFPDATGYAVAPGGEVLLFEAGAGESSDKQLFVANVDGTNVRQLTDVPGGATWGAWSPDGKTVVALVGEGIARGHRDVDLVLINVAKDETTQLASGRRGDFWEPHFAPDGQQVLFGRFTKPMGSDTFGIPVGGGDAALVLEDRWNAILSPDGMTIVYTADASLGNVQGPELWLADADGSHPRPLVPNAEPFSDIASWTPDSTQIVYTRLRPDADELVAVVDVGSGAPTFAVRAPRLVAGVWLDDENLLIDVGS